jgi:GlpG protein
MSVDPIVSDQAAPSTSDIAIKPKLAIVTIAQCVTCILLFLLIQLSGKNESWDELAKFGYLSSDKIWDGAYWGLLSSAYIHLAIWHLVFNVYWFWRLGGAVELYTGPWKFLLFTLCAAFVSSAVQLAVSGSTGYGASGVVYSIFGFILAGSKKISEFDHLLRSRSLVPLFLIWLVGCVVVSYLDIYQIGNAAHISGLCFGIIVGSALFHPKFRMPAIFIASLMIIGCCITLFWSPWSATWMGYKAYKAHEGHQYQLAINQYRRSIELGMDRKWALTNIVLAYAAKGDTNGYSSALVELKRIDAKAAVDLEKKIQVSNK